MTDPRKVGGTYRSAYWGSTYTVIALYPNSRYGGWQANWLVVRESDGRVHCHCTPWSKRDSIINTPEESN